jgi:hypothetical protein
MRYCAYSNSGRIVLEWCLYLHSGVSAEDLEKTASTVKSIAADDVKELLNGLGIEHSHLETPKVKAVGDFGMIISTSVTTFGSKPGQGNADISTFTTRGFILMKTERLPTI